MLSDHHKTKPKLRTIAAEIANGMAPDFDRAVLDDIAEEMRQNPGLTRLPSGCAIAAWLPIILMLVLAAIVAGLYAYASFNT